MPSSPGELRAPPPSNSPGAQDFAPNMGKSEVSGGFGVVFTWILGPALVVSPFLSREEVHEGLDG